MARDELLCPDCGGRLNEVWYHDRYQYLCPKAIGEQAFDRDRRIHYIEQPSKHKYVRFWQISDWEIERQLSEMRAYIRIERKRRGAA